VRDNSESGAEGLESGGYAMLAKWSVKGPLVPDLARNDYSTRSWLNPLINGVADFRHCRSESVE